MEHKFVEEKGDLKITVTASNSDMQEIVNKANAFLASQVTIKGFRKGKAPLDIASKFVNPEDLNDRVSRKLVDGAFKNFIADSAIRQILDAKLANGIIPAIDFPKHKANEPVSVLFVYPLKPSIAKLGAYTKLKTTAKKEVVDDKAVEAELKRLANDLADLLPVSEKAEKGDYVNCDLKGSINDIEMPELSEKALDIVIGSNRFIPGFEDQLIGHKNGEDFQIESTLPTNYPENIAGKKAIFKVHVNSVKRKDVPAIDDNFVSLQEEYKDVKTLDELKAKIKESLTKRSEENYKNARLNELIEQILKNTEFVTDEKLLKPMLVDNQKKEDEKTLSAQGLDLKTYLRLANMSEETYATNVYNNLIHGFKLDAVIKAIAIANKLEPSEEEIAAEAKKQGVTDLANLKADLGNGYKKANANATDAEVNGYLEKALEPIVRPLRNNKVFDFLLDNND